MSLLKELLSLNEAKSKSLTAKNKADIIEDFTEWSGGFTPDECEHERIRQYIEYAMDANLDEDAVSDFLYDYDPTVSENIAEAQETAVDFAALGAAIGKEINHGGTRIFDIEMYEDDVLHFAIEFDFSEGFIKGSDVKKASKFISKVTAQKAPDWRHGQTGADYMVTLKSELSDEDGKKLVAALKKAVSKKVSEAKDDDEDEDDVKVGSSVENIQPMRAGKAYANFGSPAAMGDKGKVTKVNKLRDVTIVQFKKSDGSVVYTHVQNLK